MQLDYTARIDLLPVVDEPLKTEMRERIGKWSAKSGGTVAYSIHDAVGLVSNAKPASLIRLWNTNLMKPENLAWIAEQNVRIQRWNLPSVRPAVNLVDDLLPTVPPGYSKRTGDDIFFITIHHTVGWNYSLTTLDNAINIAYGHINGKGWPGIGYHYLIGPDGEILCTNTVDTVSYHAGSYAAPGDENLASVGVCMGGDFRYRRPSGPQIAASTSLVSNLRESLPNQIATIPHRRMAGAATICPGTFEREDWLKMIDYGDWI